MAPTRSQTVDAVRRFVEKKLTTLQPRGVTYVNPTRGALETASPRLHAKEQVVEAVEPSEECFREPVSITFRQRAAGPGRALGMGRSVRIAIKARGRILFIDTADIITVEAKGNYVVLSDTSGPHILRVSISTIEEKLNLHGFVRIHRSMLVNAALVEEIHPLSSGDYLLRVRGGRELTATRTYKKNLQLLAQLWIGTEGFATE